MSNQQSNPLDGLASQGPIRTEIVNRRAAGLSAIFDTRDDLAWFEARPQAPYRDRDASELERAAYGFPEGTFVVVRRHRGELFYFFAVHGPAFRELQRRSGRTPGLPKRGRGTIRKKNSTRVSPPTGC